MEEFKPIYTDLVEKKVNEIELKEDIDLRGISILNILYQMIHVDEYHLFVFFATTGIYWFCTLNLLLIFIHSILYFFRFKIIWS